MPSRIGLIEWFNSEDRIYSIYCISNKVNNKIYIGVTTNPTRRFTEHRSKSRAERPKQIIHKALRKYGIDSFCFDIIEAGLTRSEAANKEKRLIAVYNTTNSFFGYNSAMGGSFLHPRVSGESHPMKGRVVPKNHKFQTSKKGRKLSEYQILRISETSRNRVRGIEERIKLGEASKKRWEDGKNDSLKKRVQVVSPTGDVFVFKSISAAAIFIGAAQSGVSRACSGKYPFVRKHTCSFITA